MATTNMMTKFRYLTKCLSVAILFSCSGLNYPMSEIRVAIEMSAGEFNAQKSVQEIGNPLNASDSDLWGTDNPHTLIIGLPKGEIHFDGGGGGYGTMLASTPMSPTNEITESGKIRSVTFNLFREKYPLSEAINIAKEQCKKVEGLFDNPISQYGQNFESEVKDQDTGDGVYICRIQNAEIEFVISLTKVSSASLGNPSSTEFKIDGWVGRNTDLR